MTAIHFERALAPASRKVTVSRRRIVDNHIPDRERLVWENDELRASILRGIAQAEAGQGQRLDWVTEDDD